MSKRSKPPPRAAATGVLVELRVPRSQSPEKIFRSPALRVSGFDLDTGFPPIPTTPTADVAASVAEAGEEVVTVRGVIEEDRIPELEAREGVVKIWRDTRIEPL